MIEREIRLEVRLMSRVARAVDQRRRNGESAALSQMVVASKCETHLLSACADGEREFAVFDGNLFAIENGEFVEADAVSFSLICWPALPAS